MSDIIETRRYDHTYILIDDHGNLVTTFTTREAAEAYLATQTQEQTDGPTQA